MQRSAQDIRRGLLYGSAWVLIWGTIASIVDAVLLMRGAYASGTLGQALTFVMYGLAAVVLAVKFSGRFLGQPLAAEATESAQDDQPES